jgi:hypothetical protein
MNCSHLYQDCLASIHALAWKVFGVTVSTCKVEYTDVSRRKRLRLEDSFLPGAQEDHSIVFFDDTALFHSHLREVSHNRFHHQ